MAKGLSAEEEDQSIIQQTITKVLAPLHLATSRPAIKAYLSTILFLTASAILLTISTTAYLLFYYNYIPQVGLTRVIYLQYGDGVFPHATTSLSLSSSPSVSSLVSLQPYDVTVHLTLPKTPTNLAAGNFMLDLSLFSPLSAEECRPLSSGSSSADTTKVVAQSRRPGIVPYSSLIPSLTHTFLSLPLHALALRDIDAATLSLPMFERVIFQRGQRSVPSCAGLEIRTQPHTQAALLGQTVDFAAPVPLQVYSASIEFHARFRGLRWVMYNWRVASFLVFTSAFYCIALLSTGVAWGLFSYIAPFEKGEEEGVGIKKEANGGIADKTKEEEKEKPKIKREDDDEDDSDAESGLSLSNLSENATTFPTLGRQHPIRYPMRPPENIDRRPREVAEYAPSLVQRSSATTGGELAGDEDDDDDSSDERAKDQDRDGGCDSGMGTSLEESNREGAGLQRRRSGRGREGIR